MGKEALENLAKLGHLKREPVTAAEFNGMVSAAHKLLADAQKQGLAPESRFDLAYGAAHRLALAALRHAGYRSENRYMVFQALLHTVGTSSTVMRIFSKCHDVRNLAEYQGHTGVDEQLLKDLIQHTIELEKAVLALKPPAK